MAAEEVIEVEIDDAREYRNAFDDEDESPETETSPTDDVEDEDTEPEPEEGTVTPPAPAPPTPAAPVPEEPKPAAAPAEEPAQQPEKPFSFRVDKKELVLDGSVQFEADTANGKEKFIAFPLSEFQRTLQPHLADRTVWRNEKKQLLQELAKRDPETHPDVVKSRAVLKLIQDLISADDATALDKLDEWRSNLPVWEKDRELEASKAQLAAVRAVEDPTDDALQEIEREEFEDGVRENLKVELSDLAKLPEYTGIDPDRLLPIAFQARSEIFIPAPEDMTLQDGTRVRKGEYLVNRGVLKQIVAPVAELLKETRDRIEKAKTVEAQNKAVLKDTPKPEPKTETGRPRRKAKRDSYAAWKENWLKDVSGPVITD